jgi:hypothetical protein
MKEVADQTGEVSPTRLQTIVDEVLSDTEMLQDVVESFQ